MCKKEILLSICQSCIDADYNYIITHTTQKIDLSSSMASTISTTI